MPDNFFTKEQVGFWGAIAAFFTFAVPSYYRYRENRANKSCPIPDTHNYNGEIKMNESNEQKAGQYGIKETNDCLLAVNKVGLLIAQKLKDGIQLQDGVDVAEALFKDGEIKSAIAEARKNIEQVPAEIKDIDLMEGMTLAQTQISFVPQFINVLKK